MGILRLNIEINRRITMSEIINNREYRQKLLKEIILDLHAGKDVEEVKERFRELIKDVGPTEISELEQKLIEEGMPEEEIKRLCDVHVAVFKESLDQQKRGEETPGHPVHTFKKENKELKKVLEELKSILEKITKKEIGTDISRLVEKWRSKHKQLSEIEKHYSRKENILFPYLEKNGITGPPSVMWSIHDEIRAELKKVGQILEENPKQADKSLARKIVDIAIPVLNSIDEMVYKEENILFPMCLETFSDDEWGEIFTQSDEIGYTLIKPDKKWQPGTGKTKKVDTGNTPQGYLKLDTGIMSLQEINLMLKTIPVDITFVDKNGVVKYFSHGEERIFERTPAIIGRKVQNCHPPNSVHVVNKIVEDFKNNMRDKADFWINFNGMYVYIQYFAVRDEKGEYMGTVEVTQNIKPLRELEGEKRILDEDV